MKVTTDHVFAPIHITLESPAEITMLRQLMRLDHSAPDSLQQQKWLGGYSKSDYIDFMCRLRGLLPVAP